MLLLIATDVSCLMFSRGLTIFSSLFLRTRELLELGLDNEDSEHENDDDTNQSECTDTLL